MIGRMGVDFLAGVKDGWAAPSPVDLTHSNPGTGLEAASGRTCTDIQLATLRGTRARAGERLELGYSAGRERVPGRREFFSRCRGDERMSMAAVKAEERTHEQKLDLLAEVAVRVGLGLRAGQEVVMTASLDALPLARRITEQAYRAGASLVTTLYADDEATLMRYRLAPDESFDHAAKWLYDGMGAAFKSGAARLAIAGGNPALLSNEDAGKVGRANRAVSQAYRPALELITRHAINWTIVASATPAWAAAMFPEDAPDVALARLWEAIFQTTRINSEDPWQRGRRTMRDCRSARRC